MKYLILVLCIFSFTLIKAQETTPELITDRPDQTESSAVVPHKSLQIETGFIWSNDANDAFKQTNTTYNSTLLRYGLLKNFELRLGMEYNKELLEDKLTNVENSIKGISPLHVGFKINITEEKGLMPEMAILGGLNMPFTANEDFKTDYTGIVIRFAFTHTLSDRFSFAYNLGTEWDGDSAIPGYFYSAVLGASLADRFGLFAEFYGTFYENNSQEHLFNAGVTFLVIPNLQLDVSAGLGLNENALDNFISAGLSYRLPK